MTIIETSKEKPILMDELNTDFKYEVSEEPGGENIKHCFACGTCSVSCPVLEVNERYDPRKIIRMVLLGMKDEVLENDLIWLCSGCYTCYELCPRGVKITDVMGALRNIAVREGHVPFATKASVGLLEKFGRLLEVSEFENNEREKKGMPVLDLTIPEIKILLQKSGIRDVVKDGDSDE